MNPLITRGLIKQWKEPKKSRSRTWYKKNLIKFDDVMNDQRQVIFTRLKILKENNTSEILNDFFEEILETLDIIRESYRKSNNEKFLTEIKNITGNALNDKDLKNCY